MIQNDSILTNRPQGYFPSTDWLCSVASVPLAALDLADHTGYSQGSFLYLVVRKTPTPPNCGFMGNEKMWLRRGRAPRFGSIDTGPIRGSSLDSGSKFFEMTS